MTGNDLFHALFIVVAIAFAGLWLANLIRIGISRDKIYARDEGAAIAIARFLLLGSSLAGMAVYCVDANLMDWAALPLPPFLRGAGFLLCLAALALFQSVLHALGRNFSTTLTIKKDQTLVVKGPYRWVRHPMYLSFVLLWGGYFFLSTNWFIALTGISGFVLAIIVRTPKEEKMMIERFGDEYRLYIERTGCFLPRRFPV